MVTLREGVVVALLAGGLFFGVVAAVGLVRLPDLYTRAHSASKSDTLGAVLTLAAVAVALGPEPGSLKVGLLLVFMFITNPTAAHAIARAASEQGIEPWTGDETDSEGEEVPADDDGPSSDPSGGDGSPSDGDDSASDGDDSPSDGDDPTAAVGDGGERR